MNVVSFIGLSSNHVFLVVFSQPVATGDATGFTMTYEGNTYPVLFLVNLGQPGGQGGGAIQIGCRGLTGVAGVALNIDGANTIVGVDGSALAPVSGFGVLVSPF